MHLKEHIFFMYLVNKNDFIPTVLSVRREILDVLELPFLYPHLFPAGCPRRQGVLLYGPPGELRPHHLVI